MAVALAGCLVVAGCGSVETLGSKIDPLYGVSASPRVVAEGDPVPRGGGGYKVGKPYTVAGRTYVPAENPDYTAEGLASWYGKDFHGRKTANGEIFDMGSISAAHKTLPMPSYVRVTNLANKRSIVVRVNNRGPYVGGRVIDVSYRAAELLGFAKFGVARVRVDYLGRAPLDEDDDVKLASTLRQDGTLADLKTTSPVMVASAKPFVPEVPSMRAVPASTPPSAEAPVPPGRPYDLGISGSAGTVAVANASGWSSGPEPVSGLGFAGVPADAAR
ncbi:septal ring lytic transglycosylase RlpA family protein [Xanthobacter autotrophicus]|uniref:septal ring lytic transglycosylase RlpA family protein n=1 Tax=Xanthobacter TaxID=279 RepID=UPI0024AACF80|nr:septal ring lytic transglycosylase RlpA family protein [Xanthobacter autotrophicus]MDI4662744.1 septal ring lytic transglycosylase RlpA family protein [Xanthobacter autotrophicus]